MKGKNLSNVIADKNQTEEVYNIAKEQVMKQ
jgi:hypothetical protein